MDIVYDSNMDNFNHIVNNVEHIDLSQFVSPPQPQTHPQLQP